MKIIQCSFRLFFRGVFEFLFLALGVFLYNGVLYTKIRMGHWGFSIHENTYPVLGVDDITLEVIGGSFSGLIAMLSARYIKYGDALFFFTVCALALFNLGRPDAGIASAMVVGLMVFLSGGVMARRIGKVRLWSFAVGAAVAVFCGGPDQNLFGATWAPWEATRELYLPYLYISIPFVLLLAGLHGVALWLFGLLASKAKASFDHLAVRS